jgi:taurine dioxygenase
MADLVDSGGASGGRPFTQRLLTGTFALEVKDVDVRVMDDAGMAALKQALLDYAVVVIRNQFLDPAEQLALTRRWGEVYITPYVKKLDGFPEVLAVRNRGKAETVTEQWHHDASWQAQPAAIGILSAQVLPPAGGDTMFADQRAGYDRLSPGMQRLVDGLFAWHRDRGLYKLGGLDAPDSEPQLHPVVRTHPESGSKALYLSETMVERFDGMTVEESQPLLHFLVEQATPPEFTYRHAWQAGDVVVWDQRAVLHYAIHDHGDAERVLYRTTVAGDRPR